MRLALLAILFAPGIFACDLNVRVAGNRLEWDRYIGASSYKVTESRDEFNSETNYAVYTTSFTIPHRVSEATHYWYQVDAQFDPQYQIDGACHGAIEMTLPPDPQFRRMTRKAIVPIAGSAAGANGAHFRTSLQLLSNAGGQRGRIVFHPSGLASDSDPSIRYAFSGLRQQLEWDDVVAAIGAGGIGSLDIVPDDDSEPAVPMVIARHYTDAAPGTFGSFESAVAPFDFLRAPAMTVTIPDAHFRLNIGFRTLTATTVQALIYDAKGQLRGLKSLILPGDYFTLVPASQFASGLSTGDTITFQCDGSAIPFYTITENVTNDPAVFIPRPFPSKFIE